MSWCKKINKYLTMISFFSWQEALYQTLSICLGIQFRQGYSQIKDWRPTIFSNFFDPETQGVQELILDLFKVHSWLTYGWKSVPFWWRFYNFHENGDEVLLTIRLQTPTKTILGAVLFMYLLTNTNVARIDFFWPNMLLSCWLWTWSQQSLM